MDSNNLLTGLITYSLFLFVGEYGPNEVELQEREIVRRELEEFIQELYPGQFIFWYSSSYVFHNRDS